MQRQAWRRRSTTNPRQTSELHGLCAPQRHRKPTANCSNNGPPGAFLAATWGPLGPSWVSPGPAEGLQAHWHHGKLTANWSYKLQGEEEDEEEEGEEELSWGILVPPGSMEGLRAPQHHGKPKANWSNKPSWGCIGALFGPLKHFTRPRTWYNHGKLVEQRAFLSLPGCPTGFLEPSLGSFGPSESVGRLWPSRALGALEAVLGVTCQTAGVAGPSSLPPGALLGPRRGPVRPSTRANPGQTRRTMGPLRVLLALGPSWGFRGPTGGALGPPGVPGSRLGRPLGDYWSAFWPSGGALGVWRPSWASLGAVLGLSSAPGNTSRAPAPRRTRRKLVEQRALLCLLRGPSSWAPGGAPCAPAPRQTRGKLVEQWAL